MKIREKQSNKTFTCERKIQNDETVLRSEVYVYLRIILHRVSMTVLQFTVSRDWETINNVVLGSSISKPDQLDSEGKGAEQSSNA